MVGIRIFHICQQHFAKQLPVKNVNPHGCQITFWVFRFFFELYDSVVIIHTYHTKAFYFFLIFTGGADDSDIRTLCDMILKHFIIIHPIYTVTGCDNYIWFMTFFQKINVLIDGICCSLIPQAIVLRDRRCKYKQTALFTSKIPPFRGA